MATTPTESKNTHQLKRFATSSSKLSGNNYCKVDLPPNGRHTTKHNQDQNTSHIEAGQLKLSTSYSPNGGSSGSYGIKTVMAEIWQHNNRPMQDRLTENCKCFMLNMNLLRHSTSDGYLTLHSSKAPMDAVCHQTMAQPMATATLQRNEPSGGTN